MNVTQCITHIGQGALDARLCSLYGTEALAAQRRRYLDALDTDLNTVLSLLSDINIANDEYRTEFKELVEKLMDQSDIEKENSSESRYQ